MNRLLAIAFILFCFEVGLFLMYVPWSALWDSNLLLDYVSYIRPVVLSNVFRAGVSLLGAMDILIGISELRHFIRSFKVANPNSL